MMVVPLTAQLLREIEPQPRQKLPPEVMMLALSEPTGNARAALVDGKPIAAAGVVELWPNRGFAWALLGVQAAMYMLPITRVIRSFLADVPLRRVEMAVDADFPQAMRWADMLGFELETPFPMRAYLPDGRGAYLYARVR